MGNYININIMPEQKFAILSNKQIQYLLKLAKSNDSDLQYNIKRHDNFHYKFYNLSVEGSHGRFVFLYSEKTFKILKPKYGSIVITYIDRDAPETATKKLKGKSLKIYMKKH